MLRAGEHVFGRCFVVAVALPVAPVLVGQLPALQRIGPSFLEPAELLVVADVQPELHDDHALEHERALELHDLLVGPPPLLGRGVALEPLDQHPPVPAPVEHGHAAEPGELAVEPPEEVMALLVERRRRERGDTVVAGVEALDELADGAALAGRIGSFEHDQQPWPELPVAELAAEVES